MESIMRSRRWPPGWFGVVFVLVVAVCVGLGGGVGTAMAPSRDPVYERPGTAVASPAAGSAGLGTGGEAEVDPGPPPTSPLFLPAPPAGPWPPPLPASPIGLGPPPVPASGPVLARVLSTTSRPLSVRAVPAASRPLPASAEAWPGLLPASRPPWSGAFRTAALSTETSQPVLSWAAALLSSPTAARDDRQPRLSWPLSPVPVVTKYFDAPETPYGAGHRGVDLAAVAGQEVLAADAGVVVFVGPVGGRTVMSVDHDGGLRTTYEPIAPKVAVGEQVYRGQVLGTVLAGHPGCLVAACLHWGVRRGDEYVDPLALTGEVGEYRLKAWGGG